MATINLADVANPNIKKMSEDLMKLYEDQKGKGPVTAGREQMDPEIQKLLQNLAHTGLQTGAQDYLKQGLDQTQQGMQTAGQTVNQALTNIGAQSGRDAQGFTQAQQYMANALGAGQPNVQAGQQTVGQAVGQLQANPYIKQGAGIIGQSAAGLQGMAQGQGQQSLQDIISGGNLLAQSTPIKGQMSAIDTMSQEDINRLNKAVNRNLQENVLPSLYRSQVGAGTVGSSRGALSEGIAQRAATEAEAQGATDILNQAAARKAALQTGAFNQGLGTSMALGGRNQATQLAALQAAGKQGTGLLGAAQQTLGQAQTLGNLGINQANLGLDQSKLGLSQAQLAGTLAGQQSQAGQNLVNMQLQAATTQGNLAKLNAGTTEMGATQLQNLGNQELVLRLHAAKADQDEKQAQKVYDAIVKKSEQDQGLKNILKFLQPEMSIGGQGYIQPNTGQDVDPLKALLMTAGAGVAGSAGQAIGQGLGSAFNSWLNG